MKKILYIVLVLVAFLVSGITFIGMNGSSPIYNTTQILQKYPSSTGMFLFLTKEEKENFSQALAILDKHPVLAYVNILVEEIKDNTSYSFNTYYILENEPYEFINYYDTDAKIDFTKIDQESIYTGVPSGPNQVFIRYPYNQSLGGSITSWLRPNTVYSLRIKSLAQVVEQRDGSFLQLDLYTKNEEDLEKLKKDLSGYYPEEYFSFRDLVDDRPTAIGLIYNQIVRPGIILAIILLAYFFYEIGQSWPIFKTKLLHGFTIPRIILEQFGVTSIIAALLIFISYYAGLQFRMDDVFKLSKIAALHAFLLALFVLIVSIVFMLVMAIILHYYSQRLEGRKVKTNTIPFTVLVYLLFAALLLPSVSSYILEIKSSYWIMNLGNRYIEELEQKEIHLFTNSEPKLGLIKEGESLTNYELQMVKSMFEDHSIYFNIKTVNELGQIPNNETTSLNILINQNYLDYFFPEVAEDYEVGDIITSQEADLGPLLNLSPYSNMEIPYFENYQLELIDINDIFVDRINTTLNSPLNSPNVFFIEDKVDFIREELRIIVENYGYEDVVIVSQQDIIEQSLILQEERFIQSIIFSVFVFVAILLLYILVILSYISFFENQLSIERVHGYSVLSSYLYLGILTLIGNVILTVFLWLDGYQYLRLDHQESLYYYGNAEVILLMSTLTLIEFAILLFAVWQNEKRLLNILKGNTINEVKL